MRTEKQLLAEYKATKGLLYGDESDVHTLVKAGWKVVGGAIKTSEYDMELENSFYDLSKGKSFIRILLD